MLTALHDLTDRDLDAIADLERRVVAADGGRLKLEWGTLRNRSGSRIDDLLWWDGERLVGFCGFYGYGTQIELAGMVGPDHRRRGIATALLDAALPLARDRGAARVLLVTPRTTDAGRAFALHRGGQLDHSEHYLELDTAPPAPTAHDDVTIRDATPGDEHDLRHLLDAAFGPTPEDFPLLPRTDRDRQLVLERHGRIIGCLRLNRADARRTGVYGFAIDPALRGQGIGRAVLARVCRDLRSDGAAVVTLEVAVDNDHALGLYTSIGFERVATEDYFAVAT